MDVTYGPVNFAWEGGFGGFGGDHLIIRGGGQSVQSSPTRNKEVTHNGTFGGIR